MLDFAENDLSAVIIFGDIDELVMHEVSANVGRPSELYSQW